MTPDLQGTSAGSISVPMVLLAWTRHLLEAEVSSPERRAALLSRAGVDEATLTARDARIGHEATCALWSGITDGHPDPLFGVHFAERLSMPALGIVGYLAMSSTSALDALRRYAAYHGLFRVDARAEVIEDDTTVRVTDMPLAGHAPWPRHLGEAILFVICACIERWSGRAPRPVEVRFQHEEPLVAPLVAAAFRGPVRFGQPVNELTFALDDLRVPFQTADAALLEYLTPVAERAVKTLTAADPLLESVEGAVRAELSSGDLSLARIARRLGVGERTLQRRLRERALSFQAIVDQVRRDAAGRLLDNPHLSVDEVALLLGYADSSSFRRAHKRWTSQAPRRPRDDAPGQA